MRRKGTPPTLSLIHIFPPNVVAVGCPCRVLREISDYDRAYYRKGMNIDWSAIKE